MFEPSWLTIGRSYLGMREIAGKETAPVITRWLKDLRAWWSDDETPWCGVFVAAVMREAGYGRPSAWYRAKAWAEYGTALDKPEKGCIVVYDRKGGGHVGFVVSIESGGRIMTLGGNQGNVVSIAPFDPERVLAYRWPPEAPPPREDLPLVGKSSAQSSNNEA
jgi:uncharacterized protein (TIGR02594 family)